MDRRSAQIHDKKKNRRNGRRDEQASRDAGSNDSFRGRVWRDVLFALARQFAMVEIAASIVTGVQLYLLSPTVGDLIEGKTEGRKTELAASLMLRVVAAFLAATIGILFWIASVWIVTNGPRPMQRKMAAAKRPTSVAQQWLP